MPAVLTHGVCPFCGKKFSRQTCRRHSRSGCGAAQREALRQDTTLQRILNPDMTAAPARPRRRRKYQRRNPPASPPPAPPRQQSESPRMPPDQVANANSQPTSSGPVEDEFERLIRDLPRDPNSWPDTPGAGSSQSNISGYIPCPTLNNPDEPPTAAESAPWLRGLSAAGVLRQELIAQAANAEG